ncbi:LIM-domain binding protein-domain-containing protein [Amylocystis lapponica]|nr:LIM-domain binding protein-domain-containing protein [Amylocystis lapponica]
MNVHPDMLRQQGIPHLSQNMLGGMGSQHFLPQQQPQGQQSQPQPQHMALHQNNQNPNPPMALLGPGGQPNNAGPMYPLQLQQANQQHRAALLQSQSAQGMNPQRPVGQPHLSALGHNQMQGMPFQNGMMPQQQLRRVSSQPQGLNQGVGHLPGVQQGMNGINGLSMNQQNGMAPQLRQAVQHTQQQQQQIAMRMQQQQQQHHQLQGMSPDMSMAMNRQPHMPVNGAMPPHARTSSAQAQLMASLPQQNGMPQSHPGGIQQPSMHQNAFNPMGLPHQHQQMSSSPHAGSQTHTPANLPANIPAANSVSPHAAVNRNRMTPDNTMFMNFQNPQNIAHSVSRMQPNNPQFPFVPSSTPPNQIGDMSQSGSGTRMTPAQVFEHMTQGGDSYSAQFNMSQSQQNQPPRPPSHNGPHAGFPMQSTQQHHHQSPHQQDHMIPHMSQVQRPQSQPHGQQRQSPPQQPGASRTPRVSQPPLPMNAGMPPGRIPPMSAPHLSAPQQPPPNAQGHPLQIAPRQQQAGPSAAASTSTAGSAPANHQDGAPPSQHQPALPPPPPRAAPMANANFLVGLGQGISRLMTFSMELANETKDKMELSYWERFVRDFYTPKSVLKITLWKDNQRNEAKPFEIGVPILPRFFLVTTQSGVKSMSIHLEGARERLTASGHGLVECIAGQWTFRYTNGYTITLRGPFSAHVVVVPNPPGTTSPNGQYTLKFEHMQFDAVVHEKLIHIGSIAGHRSETAPMTPGINGAFEPSYEEPKIFFDRASIPSEPVNAFGIPQATMRCLELAESVAQMSDLIQFSRERELGPMEALAQFAAKLRFAQSQQKQQQSHPPHPPQPLSGAGHGQNPNQNATSHSSSLGDAGNSKGNAIPGSSSGSSFSGANGAGPSASHYPGAPGTSAAPSQGHPPPSTPQNQPAVLDAKSQQKAPAAPSSQASGSTPASASTPAAATPGGPSTTPSMASATLKRKAPGGRPDTSSPTMANAEQAPPAKRVTRKRGRTQGG